MKTTKTAKANIGLRQRIVKTFNTIEGPNKGKLQRVADKIGCTYWQVYNAVNGRVKLERTPRSDKGEIRNKKDETPSSAAMKPEHFESLDEYLEYQLTVSARELSKRKYSPEVRVRLLQSITRMKQQLTKAKIESWIKRPEAVLIVKIMLRLKPDLSDDNIKKIYQEEYEKLQRDLE